MASNKEMKHSKLILCNISGLDIQKKFTERMRLRQWGASSNLSWNIYCLRWGLVGASILRKNLLLKRQGRAKGRGRNPTLNNFKQPENGHLMRCNKISFVISNKRNMSAACAKLNFQSSSAFGASFFAHCWALSVWMFQAVPQRDLKAQRFHTNQAK